MKRKMTLSFDGEKLLHISVTEKGRKKKLYPVKTAADVLVQTNEMLDTAQIAVASAALEELPEELPAEVSPTNLSEEGIPNYILERIDFLTKVGDLGEALDFAKSRAVDYPSSPVLKGIVSSLEEAMEVKRAGWIAGDVRSTREMEQIVAEQRLNWIQRETSGALASQHALQHPVNSTEPAPGANSWMSSIPHSLPSMAPPTHPTPVFEEVPIASLSDADKTKTVCARPKKQTSSLEE